MTQLGPVVDNPNASRFELTVDQFTAFAAYQKTDKSIVFTHTEVPRDLRGRGVGQALARGALDIVRERGIEAIPICPFMAEFIRSHTEYRDLVSASNRLRLNLD